MPQVDMPLEQLQTYEGRNPRPDDFDKYWDDALGEMHALDPQIERTPSDFACSYAICEDLFFTGVGGARIHCKLVRPKEQSAPGPGLCHFHGYGGQSSSWVTYLPYAAAGFTILAMDVRGQGGLSTDPGGAEGPTLMGQIVRGALDPDPRKLFYRGVFLDTAQMARILMDFEMVDATRVGAFGGSQGGALTISCAALEPRIARAFSVYPFLCDYKRVWEMDLAKDAYDALKAHFIQRDPRHAHADEFWTRLGYVDLQHLAPRIRGHVCMATGLMDTICPPSTQFAMFNKITAPKEVLIAPDFGHQEPAEQGDTMFTFLTAL